MMALSSLAKLCKLSVNQFAYSILKSFSGICLKKSGKQTRQNSSKMVKDRLAELQAKHEQFCKDEDIHEDISVARFSSSEIQLDLCLHKVTEISKEIKVISNDVQQMKTLQKNIISNPLVDKKEVKRLEQTSDKIFDDSAKIQEAITHYRQEVVEMQMHKTHERLITNHLNKLQGDLTMVRNDYKIAQVDYINMTKKLHQREYYIVTGHDDDDPDDPNKIHTPLPAEFLGDYFVEAEKIKMELRHIKARDKEIKKIEEGVIEVYQLFKEINSLLMQQGDKIDTIERSVENAVEYVEKGKIQLKQAQIYKYTVRRRKICCVGFLIVILVIVAVLVAMVIFLKNDDSD